MTALRDATPIMVANDQDSRTKLVSRLAVLGYKSARAAIPVDLAWAVEGEAVMFDLKTAEDMVASVEDGRLHAQLTAMKDRKSALCGFILEGTVGDGLVVGRGPRAWPVERFDNLLLSLQTEGAVIIRSASQAQSDKRVGAVYDWTRKSEHGSWHAPTKPYHAVKEVYTDRTWRRVIEFLMGLPGMGEQRANDLVDRYPLHDILGTTPEGLREAMKRWSSTPGIGNKTAQEWHDFLMEDFSAPLIKGYKQS